MIKGLGEQPQEETKEPQYPESLRQNTTEQLEKGLERENKAIDNLKRQAERGDHNPFDENIMIADKMQFKRAIEAELERRKEQGEK